MPALCHRCEDVDEAGDDTGIDRIGTAIGLIVKQRVAADDRHVPAAAAMHRFRLSVGNRAARHAAIDAQPRRLHRFRLYRLEPIV
jgi:hypothetical protein